MPNARGAEQAAKSSFEFAALSKPNFPILLHAGGCDEKGCDSPAKACAFSRPFQLDAKLAMQIEKPNDETVPVFLDLFSQFEKLRANKFKSRIPISNPRLIRGLFFDALSGNSAAIKLLRSRRWSQSIKNEFKKAFVQLGEVERLCSVAGQPEILEVGLTPSFYPFAGLISWADNKSISVSLDRAMPENDIKVIWPLALGAVPLSTRFSRIGIKTRVSLFTQGHALGSVTAVRGDSIDEIELVDIPKKLRAKLIEIGNTKGAVAVANRPVLQDPDSWQSIKLPQSIVRKVSLVDNKAVVSPKGFFSRSLQRYLIAMKTSGSVIWFKFDGNKKFEPLEKGFEPLIAADFFNRGHSQWVGRTNDGQVLTVDLSNLEPLKVR